VASKSPRSGSLRILTIGANETILCLLLLPLLRLRWAMETLFLVQSWLEKDIRHMIVSDYVLLVGSIQYFVRVVVVTFLTF
jgi:hypothetical protein